MRSKSHATLVGMIRQHVVAWRKGIRASRETAVQIMVEAHERIDGPAATNITFAPHTTDPFERQKVNADRVFRWLDDESKDCNTIPANFIPSALIALPEELRARWLEEFAGMIGLSVTATGAANGSEFDAHRHLGSLIKESSEAGMALNDVSTAPSVECLERARREVSDVLRSSEATLCAIDAELVRHGQAASNVMTLSKVRA